MKGRRIISETGLLLAAILAIAVIIVCDNTFTSIRLDLTDNKLFTLSNGTVNILKSLKEPVNLDFYLSRKTLTDYPSIINYGNRVRDLLKQYAAEANGNIKLTVIEPEPFSEAEDQAVASGLQGVPINTEGDVAYFGLVGTNSIDEEKVIPFFQNERESSLEYDITKLIYNLANPKKRVIGVMSTLPLFGSPVPQQPQKPWAIVNVMREFFDVRNISMQTDRIDDDVDVLMVIHPKDLGNKTLYAIDQYLLAGGKAMLFIDPMAEADRAQPNPQNPMAMPPTSSNLKRLMDTWGVDMKDGKIVGDLNLAMRVQARGPRGPQELSYLPWLRLESPDFNHDDFATNELNTVNFASAGVLEQNKGSALQFIPLMQTTSDTMLIDSNRMLFGADPASLLNEFVSDNKQWTLAARISGTVKTSFPEGMPADDDKDKESSAETAPAKPAGEQLKEGTINAILVADTDILSDYMWIRTQSFFGLDIPQTLANNGDFVINALDNLSGNNDLISLRTRGNYSRPFTTVEAIRKQAESEFRDREKELQAKLDETEKRLVELQKDTSGSELILSPEQTREIEKFKQEQVNTRKELRNVQHELRKNIEQLGTELKFINIGLVPLLIAFIAIIAGYIRSRRYQ